jgi:hypothetical protein
VYFKTLKMEKEIKNKPVQYTIENKNGVYEYSDSFEVNGTTSLIRIKVLEKGANSNDWVEQIVKKFLIKGNNFDFSNYFNVNGIPPHFRDIFIDVYLNNINDLTFELIENSKIQVTVFPNKYQNIEQ